MAVVRLVVLGAFAAITLGMFLWRGLVSVHGVERKLLAWAIPTFLVFPIAGGLLRGLSDVVMLGGGGPALVGMLIGTGGHPERMYYQWLDSQPKMSIFGQVRVATALILVAFAGIGLWEAALNG